MGFGGFFKREERRRMSEVLGTRVREGEVSTIEGPDLDWVADG